VCLCRVRDARAVLWSVEVAYALALVLDPAAVLTADRVAWSDGRHAVEDCAACRAGEELLHFDRRTVARLDARECRLLAGDLREASFDELRFLITENELGQSAGGLDARSGVLATDSNRPLERAFNFDGLSAGGLSASDCATTHRSRVAAVTFVCCTCAVTSLVALLTGRHREACHGRSLFDALARRIRVIATKTALQAGLALNASDPAAHSIEVARSTGDVLIVTRCPIASGRCRRIGRRRTSDSSERNKKGEGEKELGGHYELRLVKEGETTG
jgi:hypothetical protein